MLKAASALAVLCLSSSPLLAQTEAHVHVMDAGERLGTVSFSTSCNAKAQASFTRAVALLHSFWYEEAEKAFGQAAAADPRCGMAWWGVAMSNYHQVWPTPYSPAELDRGIAAAAKAKSAGAKTPREQGYIDAIATFYRDAKTVDIVTRARAYEAQMARLTSQFTDDDEAAIFYGLSLVAHGLSTPTDKTYAYQKQAAAILNGLLEKHPDHPGIAHYLIHSFDYPALAPLALNAAYSYAKIAPSSPHALHMPSHIFVRLGLWQETIDSNMKSANAAREHASRIHPGAVAFDSLHAYDYLAYAYLQRGESDKVRALVDELATIHGLDTENFAGYYALAAIPARFTIERQRWSDAAALTVRPSELPWDRYPYAAAITYFARAVGAARSGNVAAARIDVDMLKQLRAKLVEQKSDYWAAQVDVQRQTAEAWLAFAEGRRDEALRMLSSAADLEDSMDKSPVTPGPIVPAREMLGDLLLQMGSADLALQAFKRSLEGSPNRLNALSGAARAAQLTGDRAAAAAYYEQVSKLLGTAR